VTHLLIGIRGLPLLMPAFNLHPADLLLALRSPATLPHGT
jgi:hypothetical protein